MNDNHQFTDGYEIPYSLLRNGFALGVIFPKYTFKKIVIQFLPLFLETLLVHLCSLNVMNSNIFIYSNSFICWGTMERVWVRLFCDVEMELLGEVI